MLSGLRSSLVPRQIPIKPAKGSRSVRSLQMKRCVGPLWPSRPIHTTRSHFLHRPNKFTKNIQRRTYETSSSQWQTLLGIGVIHVQCIPGEETTKSFHDTSPKMYGACQVTSCGPSGEVEVISLPEGAIWPTEDSGRHLFVRKCDENIFDEIERWRNYDKRDSAMVIGNPGVANLSYYLYRYAGKHVDVCYHSVEHGGFLFEQNGTVTHFEAGFCPSILSRYITPNCIYLFDPGNMPTEPIHFPCFTINAPSFSDMQYKAFLERKWMLSRHVPCWNLEEVLAVVPYIPGMTEELAKRAFDTFGGIPRYLLRSATDYKTQAYELDCVINSVKRSYLTTLPWETCMFGSSQPRLLMYTEPRVANCLFPYSIKFTSPYIEQRVLSVLYWQDPTDFESLLCDLKQSPWTTLLYESAFRYFALIHLRLGKDLTICSLETKESRQLIYPDVIRFDDQSDSLEKVTLQNGVYYIPPTPNKVYDALLMMDNEIYLFNMMPILRPRYTLQLKELMVIIQDQLGDQVTIHYVQVAPSYLTVRPHPFKQVNIHQHRLAINFIGKAPQNAMAKQEEKQRQLEANRAVFRD